MLLVASEQQRVARRRRSRAVLGAVLLAIAAIAIAIAYVKPDPFSDDREVQAFFRDTSGVAAVGADVRVAGVPVGEITGRERVGGLALVTMEIDPSVGEIGDDATAELRPHLPFEGTAYVELEPGSPGASALDGPVAAERTTSYVPVDVALRLFRPDARSGLQRAGRELGRVFSSGGAGGLGRALDGAPELTATLAPAAAAAAGGSHGDELRGAIAGLSATFGALAEQRERLGPLAASAERTAAAAGGASLDRALAELPATLASVETGGAAIDRILARLDPLAEQLEPGLAELGPTLEAVTPLVERAGPVLSAATPLIADVRAALDAGAGAAPRAGTLLRDLQPTLERVNDSLIPALLAPTDELEIPAYLSFLNLFGGGGGASRPFTPAAQASAAAPETGHFMRFGFRFISGVGLPLPPCSLLEQANPAVAAALSAAGGCTP